MTDKSLYSSAVILFINVSSKASLKELREVHIRLTALQYVRQNDVTFFKLFRNRLAASSEANETLTDLGGNITINWLCLSRKDFDNMTIYA